jgi:hypothetical protein
MAWFIKGVRVFSMLANVFTSKFWEYDVWLHSIMHSVSIERRNVFMLLLFVKKDKKRGFPQ